jgi:hypothetical protein
MVSPRKNETSETRGREPTPARSVCWKKMERRKGGRPWTDDAAEVLDAVLEGRNTVEEGHLGKDEG